MINYQKIGLTTVKSPKNEIIFQKKSSVKHSLMTEIYFLNENAYFINLKREQGRGQSHTYLLIGIIRSLVKL